jgi:hypothetical protein
LGQLNTFLTQVSIADFIQPYAERHVDITSLVESWMEHGFKTKADFLEMAGAGGRLDEDDLDEIGVPLGMRLRLRQAYPAVFKEAAVAVQPAAAVEAPPRAFTATWDELRAQQAAVPPPCTARHDPAGDQRRFDPARDTAGFAVSTDEDEDGEGEDMDRLD